MSKLTKFAVGIVLALTVFIGLDQLSYKNDVFAKTLALCCNAGLCDGSPCSSPSTIQIPRNGCNDYTADCYTCMDLKTQAELCPYSHVGDYCLDENGDPYYGGK